MHLLLYTLHVGGMALLLVSAFLVMKERNTASPPFRWSVIMMSAAHTQILTGFILFFMLLTELNHMKVGIKMLLAISLALFATLHHRALKKGVTPARWFMPVIIALGITITAIAFLV
ncbi:MAG: hypothetical protein F9K22_01690 [Bacteroidetes bacterium]|nr:MAG: hypothetical protein F9K22_01690 [Bacteroidota bacterium]